MEIIHTVGEKPCIQTAIFNTLKLKKCSGFHISLGHRTDFKPCLITTCEIGKKEIGVCIKL